MTRVPHTWVNEMHAACLVAEYLTVAKAQLGLQILTNLGFASDALSIVSLADSGTTDHVALIKNAPDDANDRHEFSKSIEVGALLVGTALAPAFIGSMIGPLMIAGPLLALLAGAAAGGLMDETLQWGIHKTAAKDYEQLVKDGSILIIVTSTPPRLDEAAASLKTTGPKSLERFEYRP